MPDEKDRFIHFRCTKCIRSLKAKRAAIGKTLRCPACFTEVTVPEQSVQPPDESTLYAFASPDASASEMTDDSITVACPVCGARTTAAADQEGKSVPCPDCDTPVRMIRPKKLPDRVIPDKPLEYEGSSIYGVQGEPEPYSVERLQDDEVKRSDAIEHDILGDKDEDDISDRMIGALKKPRPDDPSAKPVPSKKRTPESGKLVPVACRVCATRMHADESEIGKPKVCPDCGTKTIVPMPLPDLPSDPLTAKAYEGSTDYGVAGEGRTDDPNAPVIALVCRLCGTRMYASPDEVGRGKSCPDCETVTTVPDIPPKPMKFVAGGMGSYDVGAPPEREEPRVNIDYVMLEKRLERERREKDGDKYTGEEPPLDGSEYGETERKNYDDVTAIHVEKRAKLPKHLFFSNILTMAWDWNFWQSAVPIVIGMAIGGYVVVSSLKMIAQGSVGPVIFGLFGIIVGGFPLLMVVGSMSMYGFLIAQNTAEGADRIESWPEFDFVGWFVFAFRTVLLATFAALPGALYARFFAGWGVVGYSAIGASLFLLFPYFALSYLSSGSLMEPISSAVAKTMTRIPLSWLQFYGIAGLVAAVELGMIVPLAIYFEPGALVVAPIVFTLSFFLYFRLLGRLAWKCNVVLREMGREEDDDDDD